MGSVIKVCSHSSHFTEKHLEKVHLERSSLFRPRLLISMRLSAFSYVNLTAVSRFTKISNWTEVKLQVIFANSFGISFELMMTGKRKGLPISQIEEWPCLIMEIPLRITSLHRFDRIHSTSMTYWLINDKNRIFNPRVYSALY